MAVVVFSFALFGWTPPGGAFAWTIAGAALATVVWRRFGCPRTTNPASAFAAAGSVAPDSGRFTPFPGVMDDDSRQLQKMEAIGRLAGGVAHDFNNLLTVINGCSDLLLASLPASSNEREMLQEIRKAGERGAALTRQLLAFSRKQVIQPRRVDLSGLVKNLEKMLHRLVREDIHLVLNLHPIPLPVLVDPGQIEQVLMNLVINSRDAMPTGGTITIATDCVDEGKARPGQGTKLPPGPYARLKITDTGCGMDAATLARIFEPFFTTKEKGKGTGLGLATVYGIVQQSGGQIDVASEPGRGTTFRIRLPLAAEEASEEAPFAPRPDSVRGGPETILLVEDEDGVRALVQRTLETLGYTVLAARDGMEALVLSRNHRGPIDLVVTDVVMPHLGGAELVPILKRRHPHIRTIFMSGYTESVVVGQGVEFDEVEYIDKPFTAEELARLVRQVLEEVPA